MINLVQIIRKECIPHGNCLLTVFDERGETGFLYFKDCQLIEVNQGKTWGKEAFYRIFYWNVANYTLGELPLGIKQTLWEPLEKMMEEAQKVPKPPSKDSGFILDRSKLTVVSQEVQPTTPAGFADLPEVLAVYIEKDNEFVLTHGEMSENSPDENWLFHFSQLGEKLGQKLGAGKVLYFHIGTEAFHVWLLKNAGQRFAVVAQPQLDSDAFEQKLQAQFSG